MRPLDLDFQQPQNRIPVSNHVVLTLGLFVLVIVLSEHWWLQRSVAIWKERDEQLREQHFSRRSSDGVDRRHTEKPTDEHILLEGRSVPWGPLFQGFELAKTPQIALVTMAPDVKKGQVRVEGEARSFEDVIVFLKRLQQQPILRDVVLVSHEIREDEPDTVHFALEAAW